MHTKGKQLRKIIVLLSSILVIIGLYLLAFPYNEWLSLTMPRHQVIQLPAAILIGLFYGISLGNIKISSLAIGISILIFASFSITFWMIPRSVDLTVVYPNINRLMILHLFLVGLGINLVFKAILTEAKIAFLGMMTAMTFVSGLTLNAIQVLLCGSFDLDQQHETGTYLLIIGAVLFIYTIGTLISNLGKKEK